MKTYFSKRHADALRKKKLAVSFTKPLRTSLLLSISNIFMIFAWYEHLKYKDSLLWIATLESWGIALVECSFLESANRIGHYEFDDAQLKTSQDVLTLA